MLGGEKVRLGIHTLFLRKDRCQIRPREARKAIWSFLGQKRPDCIAIPGYRAPGSQSALVWALKHDRPAILMSESKQDDFRRHGMKEHAKGIVIQQFDAALVGGRPHLRYMVHLGIPARKVFVGYDVVDNAFFEMGADSARLNAAGLGDQWHLPPDFFLTVCRQDQKKNIRGLFKAYAEYQARSGLSHWALVLCGPPSDDREILRSKKEFDIRSLFFPGFLQARELTALYGLSSCYIAPSLTDQWNLTVNEAMASGLPVLVSRGCGCAEDLVREGVNGYTFDPRSTNELANLMLKMSSGAVDLKAMGQASRAIIAKWSPQTFAENLWRAAEAALEQRSGHRSSLVSKIIRMF